MKGRRCTSLGRLALFVLLGFSLVPVGNLWAAQDTKPIELSFALHIPAKSPPYVKAFLPWAKELEQRSNGRLKIKFYLSQTLAKSRDAYDAVKTGVADMTWVAFSLNRGRFPLSTVMELPFLSPDTYTGSHVLTDLYKKFPKMSAEVNDVHLLSLWVTLPYEIHTVSKSIQNIEDVKGLKLATQPGASAVVEAIGAVPVTSPIPEIYTMLEKGVADGTVVAWGALNTFKLYEVTKYHTNPHLGGVPYCHVMNSAKWKKLPEDLKAVITEVTENMLPDTLCQAVNFDANQGTMNAKERGHEIVDLSSAEQKLWIASAKTEWDNWAKKMDGKGLPGRAVLDEALNLIEKYRDYGKNK